MEKNFLILLYFIFDYTCHEWFNSILNYCKTKDKNNCKILWLLSYHSLVCSSAWASSFLVEVYISDTSAQVWWTIKIVVYCSLIRKIASREKNPSRSINLQIVERLLSNPQTMIIILFQFVFCRFFVFLPHCLFNFSVLSWPSLLAAVFH